MSRAETGNWKRRGGGTGALLARLAERFIPEIAGSLTIHLPNGGVVHRTGLRFGPVAEIRIRRWRGLARMLLRGEPGFVDGYLDGDWSTPELDAIFDLFLVNEATLSPRSRTNWFVRLRGRILQRFRDNTRRGSRRNIAAHYDLGNDFYALWLDRGMNYSAALFEGAADLESAQIAKLDRIAALLDLKPDHRLLEIGCGWGGLAERVAKHCRAYVGLTLSTEQRDYAASRPGVTDASHAEVRLQDYRDVNGRFDRIASIEMFEAVGEKYWPLYFDKLRNLLSPPAIVVMQVIVIAPHRFAAYSRRPDYIQRHIFPGGMLPTIDHIREQAARVGLAIEQSESLGASYVLTLREWRRRFTEAWPRIKALGFDERFFRLWTYYLAYCEAGFRRLSVDVLLLRLGNPSVDGSAEIGAVSGLTGFAAPEP
jgi:cyclopropane-fatty-acyl-phospholipid synthase